MGQDGEAGPQMSAMQGRLLALVAAVMWSLAGVFIKVLTRDYEVDPWAIACLRSGFGGLMLAWALPRLRGAPRWRTGGALIAYTFVMGAFVISTVATTAANAIFLQYAYPLFVAVGAVAVFRARLGPRTLIALAVGMAGVGTILVGSWEPGHRVGTLCGFSTAFALAAFTLLQRSIRHPSPIAGSSFYNLGAALLLLGPALVWGSFGMSLEALAILALMGAVQLSIPYVLFMRALAVVPATEVALITLIEPILNPVWVWLAVAEKPHPSTMLGGGLILAALAVCFARGQRRAVPPAPPAPDPQSGGERDRD